VFQLFLDQGGRRRMVSRTLSASGELNLFLESVPIGGEEISQNHWETG
jgi:hypothetical protein